MTVVGAGRQGIAGASLAWLLAAMAGACGASPAAPCTSCENAPVQTLPAGTSPADVRAKLATLVLPKDAARSPDASNRYADDPRAAALGQKFFFETRFSGPLLDEANDGTSGTLGKQGEAGRVSCSGCHSPQDGVFADVRSPRGQLSLGSGWTHRKAPSLLDAAELRFLMWDGRRDSAFSQVFSPIESPLELNSSRLFVAQRIAQLYKFDYEAVFGAMPSLDAYPLLQPSDAGCATLPDDPVHERCAHPGQDDEAVTRIVANAGKAIQAFVRRLTCGRSRFDAWMDGDQNALTNDEKAGAAIFVGKGACAGCHSGPYFTDRSFHNLGVPGQLVPFTGVFTDDDPGAAPAVDALRADSLNSKGPFADAYDGRLDELPTDTTGLDGSLHTPSLRCASRRPSFMHNAEYRSLDDVVDFFSKGSAEKGYVGKSENYPRNFTTEERAQLVAFLKALDGSGPDPSLRNAPPLP